MIGFPPKAILFDWDGTLVDTCELVLKAHNHVRLLMGLEPWKEEDLFGGINRSARDLYPEIYGERSQEAIKALYTYIDKTHLEHLKIMDHADVLLEFLHESGIPMGVISNKRDDVLKREIAHLGWEGFFPAIVGAGAAREDKPSAEPFCVGCNLLLKSREAGGCWYVGDTETDLLGAKNAGCLSVFLTHGKEQSRHIQTYAPFLVVENLKEFHNIIKA